MSEENTKVVTHEEDSILDSILDNAGVTKETSYNFKKPIPTVKQEAQPEATNEKQDGRESETSEISTKEEPASSEENTRPQDSSPELKAAYKALRRDGVPYNLLDKMSVENPEDLLEWANKARKRQEDIDSRLGKKESDSSEDNEVKDENQTQKDATEDSTDDTISKIKEQFGDEASEPLLRLNTQLQQQNEKLQAQMRVMQETQLSDSLALSERVLSNLWPDLSTNRESIQKRMAQIGNEHPGEFSSVEQMMFAAAVDVLGKPKNQEKVNTQPNQSAAEPDPRDLGQPAKESGGNMPQGVMSKSQIEDLALEAILDGKGLDGAKRAIIQS